MAIRGASVNPPSSFHRREDRRTGLRTSFQITGTSTAQHTSFTRLLPTLSPLCDTLLIACLSTVSAIIPMGTSSV